MTVTCAGACCAVFPMHLEQTQFAMRKGRQKRDIEYIADMLIPLTRRQALARSRRLGYGDPPKYGKNYGLFTCRHWDEQTRLCTAYDERPDMCRDYPYVGRSCERGCGYKIDQKATTAIADRNNETWEWDVEANGWRPRSNSDFLWDRENGVLRKIPQVPA